jgi:hypothetical protein
MSSRKIADRLIASKTRRDREMILTKTAPEKYLEIAHELKNICYEVWTSEPTKAQKTALALEQIAKKSPHPEIEALAFWVAGIAELTRGKLENSIANLDQSAAVFRKIKREHEAANTQVALLIVLALLGKYAEAVKNTTTSCQPGKSRKTSATSLPVKAVFQTPKNIIFPRCDALKKSVISPS